MIKRIFLIVMDSLGIGALPDAAAFSDEGSNTLASIRKSPYFKGENLKKLGLFNIDGVEGGVVNPAGAYGRFREKSAGKDTTVGHWEIAGLVSEKPLPVFPDGFPAEIISEFEKLTGRKVLCNKPYSGTEVIKDFGREHVKTGCPIVYTSADSVFQIAAHEDVIPVNELYGMCGTARKILTGEFGVGRVIARPFTGTYPDYVRTDNRRDFSLTPPKDTMLDLLKNNGLDTIGVGKISDIFNGKGIGKSYHIKDNSDGMRITENLLKEDFYGLCFVNLVDFDMKFGHRNDVDGYAKAVAAFDGWLPSFVTGMRPDDMLIITSDHGCDPSTPSTDHSREYTFALVCGRDVKKGVNLGTRDSFADISATILNAFGIENTLAGRSFYSELIG
ncbi:MAG: phosphopentomutase [Eubacteriales bacterium]|nr:phosphopentomutase [Eubacteriales bacterium]